MKNTFLTSSFLLLALIPGTAKANAIDPNPEKSESRQNSLDLSTTENIKDALRADNELSIAAQDISITTLGGEVTLRGVVDSPQEEQVILSKVRSVSGVNKVIDQLQASGPTNFPSNF